jgi:hypothetical protein
VRRRVHARSNRSSPVRGRVAKSPCSACSGNHTVVLLPRDRRKPLTGLPSVFRVRSPCPAKRGTTKSQGRDPSFVALEGYDTIAVLAHALEHTPDLSAESTCSALRGVAAPRTRGVVSARRPQARELRSRSGRQMIALCA